METFEEISSRLEPDAVTDALAHAVIGAAIEVHRHLGPGYVEHVYEEALAFELREQGLLHERQKPISVRYKGHPVGEGRLDLLVAGRLIVELKAVEDLTPVHTAQVRSYLRSTRFPLGLLINFNVKMLKNGVKRVILS